MGTIRINGIQELGKHLSNVMQARHWVATEICARNLGFDEPHLIQDILDGYAVEKSLAHTVVNRLNRTAKPPVVYVHDDRDCYTSQIAKEMAIQIRRLRSQGWDDRRIAAPFRIPNWLVASMARGRLPGNPRLLAQMNEYFAELGFYINLDQNTPSTPLLQDDEQLLEEAADLKPEEAETTPIKRQANSKWSHEPIAGLTKVEQVALREAYASQGYQAPSAIARRTGICRMTCQKFLIASQSSINFTELTIHTLYRCAGLESPITQDLDPVKQNDWIKLERLERGWTQARLAEYCGKPPWYGIDIAMAEAQPNPDRQLLTAIQAVFQQTARRDWSNPAKPEPAKRKKVATPKPASNRNEDKTAKSEAAQTSKHQALSPDQLTQLLNGACHLVQQPDGQVGSVKAANAIPLAAKVLNISQAGTELARQLWLQAVEYYLGEHKKGVKIKEELRELIIQKARQML